MPVPLERSVLAGPAPEVAVRLLNKLLVSRIGGIDVVGRITEVEAYTEDDPASHTFRGRTQRNAVMFGPAGHFYVYLSYGIHRCVNVVTGPEGRGEAVLIRALDVVEGCDRARARRPRALERDLTNGPGKLTQALGVELSHDGIDGTDPSSPLFLADDGEAVPNDPLVGPRIGITKAVDLPWRFRVHGGR